MLHVVSLKQVPINVLGGVIDKDTATIKEMLDCGLDYRVDYDADVPNSAGYPTIKTYLAREAADGYIVTRGQPLGAGNLIVTTAISLISGSTPLTPADTLIDPIFAYYKMDEANAVSRLDSGPNGLTLTQTGGVTQLAGIRGNATKFTSTSSQFLSNTSSLFNLAGDYTISFWFYRDSLSQFDLINKYDTFDTHNCAFRIRFDQSSQSMKYHGSNTTTQVLIDDANVLGSAQTWYHVLVERDFTAGKIRIRTNDRTPVEGTLAGTNGSSTNNFQIGQLNAAAYMNGRLDEIGIWNRLLTSAEITWLATPGNGLF